jgi:hypothetical protein
MPISYTITITYFDKPQLVREIDNDTDIDFKYGPDPIDTVDSIVNAAMLDQSVIRIIVSKTDLMHFCTIIQNWSR